MKKININLCFDFYCEMLSTNLFLLINKKPETLNFILFLQ